MARVDNTNYIQANLSLAKEPRAYLVLSFDTANTDTHIFVSHDDVQPTGTISAARLKAYPSTTQSLKPLQFNSSIGNISPVIQDTAGGALTTLISTKLAAGFGLRGKRVQIYLGYKGLEPTDYVLYQTQIVNDYSYKDGQYDFTCRDIIRTTQTKIFPEVKTTLGADFLVGSTTTITLSDTSDFNTMYHGAGWDHLPLPGGDNKVGYFQIDDEVCSFRTITNGTTLTTIERGLFGTLETDHLYLVATGGEPTIPDDRQIKVKEFLFFDLPAVKLLYAILTSTLYGDAQAFPWGLGIDTSFIATSKFINIGVDIWDTSTDLHDAQIPATFRGLKEIDAKQFIETELLPLIGCFTPILNDGQIGLKTLTRVISDANYIRTLDESNIVSYSSLKNDMTQVANNFLIHWNKNVRSGETTRTNILLDTASQSKHGVSDKITITLNGLDGARHTDGFIVQMFNMLRDRYAGPPELLDIGVFYSENDLDVGDIVKVKGDFIRDAVTGATVDRAFEIHRKKINHEKGIVNLSLFGSTEAATPISPTAGTALTDAFYTTDMLAGNKLDAALTTTFTGGVLHLDTNGTLTGQATLPGALNNGVYWYDGNIQVDAGTTITITENIILLIRGFVQIDGKIDGKGQGLTASASGQAGGIGNTKSGGATELVFDHGGIIILISNSGISTESAIVSATTPDFPSHNLKYDGTTDFTGLTGYPTDLRGTSGAKGGDVTGYTIRGSGTTGAILGAGGTATGDGGSGLMIVHRGIAVGGAGEIDLSGIDGSPGTSFLFDPGADLTLHNHTLDFRGSSSAGGSPGGLYVVADGSAVSETDVNTTFTANIGASDMQAIQLEFPDTHIQGVSVDDILDVGTYGCHFGPQLAESRSVSHFRSDFIPANETATSDLNDIALIPTVLTVSEVTNTPESLTSDLASVEIAYTAPVDTNFSHTNLYWKYSTEGDTQYKFAESIVATSGEVAVIHEMDGQTLDFKAVSVSKTTGEESKNFITDSVTLSNTTGGVNLAEGNYFAIDQSGFDAGGTGVWIGKVGGVAKASFGDPTGQKVLINAGSVSMTGTITATTGVIGGFTIGATALTAGSAGTSVGIDSGGTNPAIYCGSATPGAAPFRVANTGALTATNATITGSITATSGLLGGWSVTASTIEDSAGRVILDHTNARIRVQNVAGTNHVTLDANGITGIDSVLGTTFNIPTDGTAPTFSSGIINSTVFNITTAGILETSAGAGNGTTAGVRINDTGVKGWDNTSTTPNFTLDATDGSITAISGLIGNWSISSGALFSGSGATTVGLVSTSGTIRIYAGSNTPSSAPFRVDQDGSFVATNATITGTITSTSGTIGNWTIGATTLANGTNIILDASNAAISINSSTFGSSGIQAQFNSGTPRMYCGNGADKFFEFDGTDLKLGRDSKLLGSDSYENDNVYVSAYVSDVKLLISTTGSGAVSQDYNATSISASSGTDTAELSYEQDLRIVDFTWAKNRRFKHTLESPSSTSDVILWVGIGGKVNGALFKFSTDGNIYGYSSASGTSTTSASFGAYTASTKYNIEIVFVSATNFKYYLDGVLKGTISTNLPTGTIAARVSMYARIEYISGASGGGALLGEYKMNQDP